MKLSVALVLATLSSTAAFTAPTAMSSKTASALNAVDRQTIEEEIIVEQPTVKEVFETNQEPQAASKPLPKMSDSLPFMARPALLTKQYAGDVGFDPLGFADSEENLRNYREAEIKHARLAMLAAAGWPLSELFDKQLANAFGLEPVLQANDRAPSVLNGGLGKISPAYWVSCIILAAAIDLYGWSKSENGDSSYMPGDLGFDPLGLYPKDEDGRQRMQLAEIKNGRLAMIAITAFAFQELVSNQAVVNETPQFFKPLFGF
jgi:hypothetical protein